MFSYKNLSIKLAGVINVTPDSFSDGKELSGVNFRRKLTELKDADLIDIGAESTAPFNKAITYQEEIRRLEKYCLPFLKEVPQGIQLSLDTYHVETIRWFIEKYQSDQLIWNDVSGRLDNSFKCVMKEYPRLHYIYSYTHIPDRSLTSRHMDFIENKLNFKQRIDEIKDEVFFKRVILDPAFGFSKTKEQNFELLNKLSSLINSYSKSAWMIGLSRKSFLRMAPYDDAKVKETQTVLDGFQLLLLKELLDQIQSHTTIYLRSHDLRLLKSLELYNQVKGL